MINAYKAVILKTQAKIIKVPFGVFFFFNLKVNKNRGFSGGPVVRILCFHC